MLLSLFIFKMGIMIASKLLEKVSKAMFNVLKVGNVFQIGAGHIVISI